MFSKLQGRLEAGTFVTGVVGLGYVGLPLAAALLRRDLKVVGIDIDEDRLDRIREGVSPVEDVPGSALEDMTVRSDFAALRECDVVVICVPTPLGPDLDPDMGCVHAVVDRLETHGVDGKLVVLESTVYPGATAEVHDWLAEIYGPAGADWFLAFSPERIDPGNRQHGLANTAKLVAGVTPRCSRLAELFYRYVSPSVRVLSSPAAAEMAKIVENSFRAVNIALANEIALVCEGLGLNVWEVIEGASTKPYGFMAFWPGPGVGGHCIPIDPLYLSWRARREGLRTPLIDLAATINRGMADHVVDLVARALNGIGRPVRDSNVLVVGVAYKPNVGDVRESPAIRIMQALGDMGASVAWYDPLVDEARLPGTRVEYVQDAELWYDCVLIVTDHHDVPLGPVVQAGRCVVDARGVLRRRVVPTTAPVLALGDGTAGSGLVVDRVSLSAV